ncbi:MAG: prepilin peptidase [Bacilli bacterium]|nr:prepilin peptidase [Bacilli bacterium]
MGFVIGYLTSLIINFFVHKEQESKYSLKYKILISVIIEVLFLLSYMINGLTIKYLYTIILVVLLSIVFFVDLKCFVIPDSMNLLLFIFSLYLVLFTDNYLWSHIIEIIGVLIFNLLILIITVFFYKIKNIEIIGFGDIKLLFSLGLAFGLTYFSYSLLISSITALFVELIILKKQRKIIPYGPYLVIGFLAIWLINIF